MTAAYATTTRLLIAAALDRPTLMGGSPDASARAAGPDEQAYFVGNLDNADVERRTRSWLVTFAPNTAELVGATVKVNGQMSAHPAEGGVRGGFIHPAYGDSAPEKVTPSGTPLDPYDRSRPEPRDKACHRSAGT